MNSIIKPARAYDESQLVRDTYLHFPGVFGPFIGMPESEGLRQWAMHLANKWAAPRQHAAPSNYDAAYYNLSGGARTEFLAALRCIQAAVWLALCAPEAERTLFEGRGLIPDGETEELKGQALMLRATIGVNHLLSWLTWREQKSIRQLLTVLNTVKLADAHQQDANRPPCIVVPNCAPETEAQRFGKLLAEFGQNLPGKPAKLRLLLDELAPLRALPMKVLDEGPADELPTRFPMLFWSPAAKYPAGYELAETFWPDLQQALHTRMEWAKRAYDLVARALDTPTGAPAAAMVAAPTLAAAEPAPDKLSLRQVALLHVYQGLVVPKAADELARQHGHQSGAKLYGHYLTVSQRAGRIGDDIAGQKLGPMRKDITAVIPHLSGAPRQQAESELQTLLAKRQEK